MRIQAVELVSMYRGDVLQEALHLTREEARKLKSREPFDIDDEKAKRIIDFNIAEPVDDRLEVEGPPAGEITED